MALSYYIDTSGVALAPAVAPEAEPGRSEQGSNDGEDDDANRRGDCSRRTASRARTNGVFRHVHDAAGSLFPTTIINGGDVTALAVN